MPLSDHQSHDFNVNLTNQENVVFTDSEKVL